MYICICHAVTDSNIDKAVDDGATSFRDLRFATGCGTQCGCCVTEARQVMKKALLKRGVAESGVMLQVVSST